MRFLDIKNGQIAQLTSEMTFQSSWFSVIPNCNMSCGSHIQFSQAFWCKMVQKEMVHEFTVREVIGGKYVWTCTSEPNSNK